MHKRIPSNDPLAQYSPLSWQVARDLIGKIQSGAYRPGDKLESIRNLASKYGVGRQVVLSALNRLASLDYVYAEPRSGVFVNPELEPERSFRLGFFVNRVDPSISGRTLNLLNQAACAVGYHLVFGFNHEEDFTLADWLARRRMLDGLLVTGLVDDTVLKEIAAEHLPYTILGHYDIPDEIPQVKADIRKVVSRVLTPILTPFAHRRIASVVGPWELRADRELAEAIREVYRRIGCRDTDGLVLHCPNDGYADIAELIETERPDVVYVHGQSQLTGYYRYFHLHPKETRPYTIVNTWNAPPSKSAFFDAKVKCQLFPDSLLARAVRDLTDRIDHARLKRGERP